VHAPSWRAVGFALMLLIVIPAHVVGQDTFEANLRPVFVDADAKRVCDALSLAGSARAAAEALFAGYFHKGLKPFSAGISRNSPVPRAACWTRRRRSRTSPRIR
jgi:hypothetical protein